MQLQEVINTRKSIRKFKPDKIFENLIEDLINCARLAPSAKNRQPWKFIITKDTLKNKIAEVMIEKEPKSNNNSVVATANAIKQAPILILVLKPKLDENIISDIFSIGGAIEHICLKATDMGLGSLWIRDTVYAQNDILKLINYENMELIYSIAIGYPNEVPVSRPKKKLNEIIEWKN